MTKVLKSLYLEYLEKFKLMTLATADLSGKPHASSILYVYDEKGDLYFCTLSDTRKVRNLREHNRVSVAMANDQTRIGIQLDGIVEELTEPRAAKIRTKLQARHPDSAPFFDNPLVVTFRLKPEECSLLNFSWGIDFRKRVTL